MATLKARLETLEATTNKRIHLCKVELMAHNDPRAASPAPVGPTANTVTRIVLMPMTKRINNTKGAIHANA